MVGDILGAGIYALVGEVGSEVGGAIWTAFLGALILASFTAFSYAELVGKYPRAAGAALYVNNAFRIPFLTFVVAFAVMGSGIASAATLSRAFAGDYFKEFIDAPTVPIAIAFLLLVTAINLRGIAESVRINLGLTVVEVSGLVLIVVIGRRRLRAQLRVQAGRERLPGPPHRRDACLLRPDRLRGLRQRGRLIVVSGSPRTPVVERLLGSLALELVRRAGRQVLVVTPPHR